MYEFFSFSACDNQNRMRYKIMLIMKLTFVLLIISILQVNAESYGQKITLSTNKVPLEQVFKQIRKQSGYTFLYNTRLLKSARNVEINVKDAAIEDVLKLCFAQQPFTYTISKNTVIVRKLTTAPLERAIDVTGTVVDEKGLPLPGASVKIKGTTIITSTDSNGQFILKNLKERPTLVISFTGYVTLEVVATGTGPLAIKLEKDLLNLTEVVVVGYGTQKKPNLTGAVAVVDFQDLGNIPQANTINILSGRMPGVSVVQAGAEPGEDGGEVTIRGTGTLNDASPLVIIDGVQATLSDLGNLTPQEISSVTVLKDASSAAIYGSRGANGVVLVTTKMPDKERISIDFSAYTGMQKATTLPDLVQSWQYMALMNEATTTKRYSDALIEDAKNGLFNDNLANTRWLEEIYKPAPLTNYNLSASGKTKGTSFMLSGGFFNQEGILKGTSSDKYSIRGNMLTTVTSKIKAGLNIWGYTRKTEHPFASTAELTRQALQVPIMPVRYANGEYAVYAENLFGGVKLVPNPVLNAEIGYANKNDMKMTVQPSLEVSILKGLTFKTAFTYSYGNEKGESFNPTYSYNSNFGLPAYVNDVSQLTNSNIETKQMQWNSTLSYATTVKKHAFNALLGHEILDYSQTFFSARGDNLPNNNLTVLSTAVSNFLVNGSKQEWALQSFFGRVNYAFDDKYLVEMSIRSDGSSRFNGEYRYSPSGSIGWVLSRENFMKKLDPVISFMKIRAGYGKLGNDRIGNYTFQQALNIGEYYTVGGKLRTTASITNFGNPNITWEQTTTTNLGLDLGFLKNRLNVNIDLYKKVTDGILFQLPLPLSFGNAKSPFQNVAQVSNKGFEISVEHKNIVGKVRYKVAVNYSYNKNNIDQLNKQRVILGSTATYLLEEGSPVNSWFGYVSDGLYIQQDQDSNYPKFNSAVVVGSVKFLDINGDGVVNDLDRKVIGDGSTPHVFGISGGVEFKGFDFTFLAQGIAGKDIYIYDYGNRPGNGGLINFWQEWWDRSYHPTRNPGGDLPIIKSQSPEAGAPSSFWLKNSSYVRLKNVEIGYTVPKSILAKASISRMRFFVSGQNILSISSLTKNLDPERANSQELNRSYPQTSIYSLGINASF
jgi:TonB-linked SusC/RagA family outer membrane protein